MICLISSARRSIIRSCSISAWTPFDRLVTHENVVHARAIADDARIDAQDRRNQVEGEVRQAYGDYKTSIQKLRSSKKGLEAAQKAYEVMEGRYEVGSASFVDLVTVQAALVQAESARAESLIDFQLQGRSIEFAIGDSTLLRYIPLHPLGKRNAEQAQALGQDPARGFDEHQAREGELGFSTLVAQHAAFAVKGAESLGHVDEIIGKLACLGVRERPLQSEAGAGPGS